jgi:nucleotide-binding universal stress UspA family protein
MMPPGGFCRIDLRLTHRRAWKAISPRFASNTCGWHHTDAGQPSSEEDTFYEHLPNQDPSSYRRIQRGRGAARTAADLSHKTDSELYVLHVLALPLDTQDPSSFEPEVWARLERGAQRTLEDVVEKIGASGGEVEGSHLTAGRPEAEIVTLAEQIGAGLIVMGSRGVGGIRRALMGSVSESVLRHAHCPVLMVRE